jgi:hypothetical protein
MEVYHVDKFYYGVVVRGFEVDQCQFSFGDTMYIIARPEIDYLWLQIIVSVGDL